MARFRSVDLLPEIFKTSTNKKFLSATLDQLVQEPKVKKTQGFVGRKFGAGVDPSDDYVLEPTTIRSNYQFEPSVVFERDNPNDVITYPGLIDAVNVNGANTARHDLLFNSEIYSWDPLIDFDKFINYSQYHWLPNGPDSVDVSSSDIVLTDNFTVTQDFPVNAYNLSGSDGVNPTLTLVRGGSYTFNVIQPSNFYIQIEPGTDGLLNSSPNINTRSVLGVVNNGEDNGTVTFNVPDVDAQQFYYDLTDIESVDLATTARFDSIHGKYISELVDIDGITDLNNRTIVFLNDTPGDSADLGWQYLDLFDNETIPFDSVNFDNTVFIPLQADRYSIYRIIYVLDAEGDPYITLNKIQSIDNLEKFTIGFGDQYGNIGFYKNSTGFFEQIPLLTAVLNTLYYQDDTNPLMVGVINIVDEAEATVLNISDIIGQINYTSVNDVKFTNGLKVIFRGNVNPASFQNNEYYVECVGEGIQLIPVTSLVTPETYVNNLSESWDRLPWDSDLFGGALNAPLDLDYLTISRASLDLNAWSRSNRWIHIDVIEQTAEYNNTTAVIDNEVKAKRPIIEFKKGLRLFAHGTLSKDPVDIIDFTELDAFSNINGMLPGTVPLIDGYTIQEGARIIFAADTDNNVRNKIYEVRFEDFDGIGVDQIHLVPSSDADVEIDHVVVILFGTTLQGKMFRYTGTEWDEAQQKTAVNQAPLFDVFDTSSDSLASIAYTNSTFSGTPLFSYQVGAGVNDTVLDFPLTFQNINNIGDIVFDNNLYKDSFTFTLVNDESGLEVETTAKIEAGFPRVYTSRTDFSDKLGWTTFAEDDAIHQIFTFVYDANPLVLDVAPRIDINISAIKVFIENTFILPSEYTIVADNPSTTITFTSTVDIGSNIEVKIISEQNSQVGYYDIPYNLQNNIFNENSETLTLGSIRNHYTSIAQNVTNLEGVINGSNNTRDIGFLSSFGNAIIQHSAPVAPMATFLRNEEYDFFKSVKFVSEQYEKYKNQVLDYVARNDVFGLTANIILDNAIKTITHSKSPTSAFYLSDMVPSGTDFTSMTYTVTAISINSFATANVYDFTTANHASLLVYLNGDLLTVGMDYTVATDGPRIEVLVTLDEDDTVEIREYTSTVGSYMPSTPTKLGLYPKYLPKKYVDSSYINNTEVIQGHDGSITVGFGDIRDDVLLELETRIYNNIKVNSVLPIEPGDIIPGKFRNTSYSDIDITNILSTSFLSWVGWHRLDYRTQDYDSTNEFTFNYSTAGSSIDNSVLKGHWRGIYKHYFDTDTPHLTPWEMLGLTIMPTWWEDEYGPAPYTSGNLVLWDDLEAGIIKEPGNEHTDTRYVRPGLTTILPVNSLGELVSPFQSVVKDYNTVDFMKSWVVGDVAPVESSWRRSSDWPFVVQRLYALTKPAQFFALSVDRDRYAFDTTLQQFLYDGRTRLDTRTIEISDTDSKHSYTIWIRNYNKYHGFNQLTTLVDELANLNVKLCYRMASFTDKKYLKVFSDNISPDSDKPGLIIPDESYQLLLYKNQIFNEIQYSSVIVQRTSDGYAVHGNSITDRIFNILNSIPNQNFDTLTVGTDAFRIPKDFTNIITVVPYGYVFTSVNGVVDFLVSYGRFLEVQGFIFDRENGIVNWVQMAQEFIAWANQNWITGSLINLNPSATTLEFDKELSIVDSITQDQASLPLDQNMHPLTSDDYVIDRLDNSFKITMLNDKTVSYLKVKLTSFEHLLMLDNTSIFNDLIYNPTLGLRQNRVRINGLTTFEWNGQVDAQGFILSQTDTEEWKSNREYKKGNVVEYKNQLWSALVKIEPAEEFNISTWQLLDSNSISDGLLPNIANKAQQFTNYYDKKVANLETDGDLLGFGLTGFRQRSYLDALNLDDTSQYNVYSKLIREKGTKGNVDLFRSIKLDKQEYEYNTFENWAVREAIYGASDNNAFIDLSLSLTNLQSNPHVIEIGTTSEFVGIDQFINLTDVYRQSEVHSTKNILPITQPNLTTDINLPSAGFVHEDDVDIALFELSNITNTQVSSLVEDSTIWVAKDNAFDWNVYRAEEISATLITIGSGSITLTFNTSSGLAINDKIAIQHNNTTISSVHIVTAVEPTSADSIEVTVDNIVLTADQFGQVIVEGSIEDEIFVPSGDDIDNTADTILFTADSEVKVFKLLSARIPSISSNPYTSGKVWADDNYTTYEFNSSSSVFDVVRSQPTSIVDTSLINVIKLYYKDTSAILPIDFIDPINGKMLGVVDQNIDYTGAVDLALYNSDNSSDTLWGAEHIGEIWWDTIDVRFVDYNQNDIDYASKKWGTLFPGSTVSVYEWIESDFPPDRYQGKGTVRNTTDFTSMASINSSRIITTKYYFWVTNLPDINTKAGKTLSTMLISSYISSPAGSGVSYASLIKENVIGLHNVQNLLTSESVLHINYDKTFNNDNIFSEYSLIKEDKNTDFLTDNLYLKLLDSLIGVNTLGSIVPDPLLNDAEKYGVSFRPRQSMFIDKEKALTNYLTNFNTYIKQFAISEQNVFNLLDSKDPVPSVGSFDFQVLNLDELAFQNLLLVPAGFKYLVLTDSNNNNGWSIYEVDTRPSTFLVSTQSFRTNRYWDFIDWHDSSINSSVIPEETVTQFSDLLTLDVVEGTIAKVTTNPSNKFEFYRFDEGSWVRVALEDGTIAINITTAKDAPTELRQILKAINEEVLIGDMKIQRNVLMVLMFNYILSEQGNVNWLYKTSFVDVENNVRELARFPVFQQDNHDIIIDYITEAKPYHVLLKEFLFIYNKLDEVNGNVTDFDVPVYFDTTFGKFISPVLDYDGVILTSDQSNFDEDGIGLRVSNPNIWTTNPLDSWFTNHLLSIDSIIVSNGGTGYSVVPIVTITGDATTPATATARIDSAGQVIEITLDTAGSGYLTTPVVTITGGNGTDALAVPMMDNNKVRSLTTIIKYDRYQYDTTIVEWEPNIWHDGEQLFRQNNVVYKANSTHTHAVDHTADVSLTVTADMFLNADVAEFTYDTVLNQYERLVGTTVKPISEDLFKILTKDILSLKADANTFAYSDGVFNPDNFDVVDSATLSGIDRTMGYYDPDVNDPGLNLALLIDGIDYPGVKVKGVSFTSTYSGVDVSTIDATVDGHGFITASQETYNSHAPEELVPGSTFDTLNLTVHTRPGFDYTNNGHGFVLAEMIHECAVIPSTIDFTGLVKHLITVTVVNITTGKTLYEGVNYTLDWAKQLVTVTTGVSEDDFVKIIAYEIGGGNQLYRNTYTGNEFTDGNQLTIPVELNDITDIYILVNGVEVTAFTSAAINAPTVDTTLVTTDVDTVTADASVPDTLDLTVIDFTAVYTSNDFISVTVFGGQSLEHDLVTSAGVEVELNSHPESEVFISDGSTTSFTLGIDINASDLTPGKNKLNAIVEHNGLRLRPPEGIQYIGNGTTTVYRLPTSGGINHDLIVDADVFVFTRETGIQNAPWTYEELKILTTDYTISPITGDARFITFTTPLALDNEIEIYITTKARYSFSNGWTGTTPATPDLIISSTVTLDALDTIAITAWREVSASRVLTNVFKGPLDSELFDSTPFDTIGFDNSDEIVALFGTANVFNIGRTTTDDRLWVTFNGRVLTSDIDYTLSGTVVVIPDIVVETLIADDVDDFDVVITSFTPNVVPSSLSYRVFDDMRGNKAMYKVSDTNTTYITTAILPTDNTIYVETASVLEDPNLPAGKFGILNVNGERITFRDRTLTTADTITITGDSDITIDSTDSITGLRRGTAGTAVIAHPVGSTVVDSSEKSLLAFREASSNPYPTTLTDGEFLDVGLIGYNRSLGSPVQEQDTIAVNFIKR